MDSKRKRKMIFDDIPGPNENWFIQINTMPSVLSKYPQLGVPNFNGYANRETLRPNRRIKPTP